MITYQDFLEKIQNVPEGVINDEYIGVVKSVIQNYQSSSEYRTAVTAEDYMQRRNSTILQYQKYLTTLTGRKVPDDYSSNYKILSNFLPRFVTEEVQYLLSNGATFTDAGNKDKLGGAQFDIQLQAIAKNALAHGVAYAFYNLDHIEPFSALEFVPMYDEEDGSIKAGIRFWQLDKNHPLRATLFELDGYTDFIWRKDEGGQVLTDKRPYTRIISSTEAEGVIYEDGANYEGFPVVPLYANQYHISELEGRQEAIDCYDLIKSGYANNIDDASFIYWTIAGAGGMQDIDLVQFLERLKTVHAAVVGENGEAAQVEPHSIDIPYQARNDCLERLERDIYRDFMALDISQLSAGNKTATEIKIAYAPLDQKTNEFEYQVLACIQNILKLAGIEDTVSFKRDKIINEPEITDMVLSAATYLDDETILSKLPFLTPEEVQNILDRKAAEDINRFNAMTEEESELETLEEQEPSEETIEA